MHNDFHLQLLLSTETYNDLVLGENIMTFVRTFWNDQRGQDLIEYTLLIAFVALASSAILLAAGASISGIWSVSNSQLAQANLQAN